MNSCSGISCCHLIGRRLTCPSKTAMVYSTEYRFNECGTVTWIGRSSNIPSRLHNYLERRLISILLCLFHVCSFTTTNSFFPRPSPGSATYHLPLAQIYPHRRRMPSQVTVSDRLTSTRRDCRCRALSIVEESRDKMERDRGYLLVTLLPSLNRLMMTPRCLSLTSAQRTTNAANWRTTGCVIWSGIAIAFVDWTGGWKTTRNCLSDDGWAIIACS
ncbi:hypothetical protein CPB85DRAFT_1360499 [Mucidula mucida]|nr:hypothetical protein CPB85DRAFT_1360499 [Mucidula mucida]